MDRKKMTERTCWSQSHNFSCLEQGKNLILLFHTFCHSSFLLFMKEYLFILLQLFMYYLCTIIYVSPEVVNFSVARHL